MSTDQIGILQLQRADLAVMSGPGVACEVLGLLCDCFVEPVAEDVLGAWVAHVPAVSACDEVFSVALGCGDDAVFDREDRVLWSCRISTAAI